MYVCMCVCQRESMDGWMDGCTLVCVCIYAYIRACIHAHPCVCICDCMQASMHMRQGTKVGETTQGRRAAVASTDPHTLGSDESEAGTSEQILCSTVPALSDPERPSVSSNIPANSSPAIPAFSGTASSPSGPDGCGMRGFEAGMGDAAASRPNVSV